MSISGMSGERTDSTENFERNLAAHASVDKWMRQSLRDKGLYKVGALSYYHDVVRPTPVTFL